MVSPLLVTKFKLPSPRQSLLVQRDRLVAQLNQGLNSRLILLSAAAGFGKTTLLSTWAHQLEQPVSWLSLDERDNDPIRFWTYLVTASQQCYSEMGAATLAMLQSSESFASETLLTPFINELAQLQTDLVLVLDDYHLITTPNIHEGMTFLLEHLPIQMHLAIATRVEPPLPLAKLRVRAQLTELPTSALRFTDEETIAFLHQFLPQSLTETQIATLQTKTEGWIAGLHLAMLSLRNTSNPAAFIDSFSGDQRYILDYLVEEVVEHQPPLLQSFLLRTSLLEHMCGSLCDAIVGEEVKNGADLLHQLEYEHLFVVPLDEHRNWYRYHHLFAESLRHILQRTEPDRLRTYHHRAAQWYEHQGYIADAIHHTTAAGLFDEVARLIEQEAQTSENYRLDAIVLRKALAALPSELIQTRPWLLAAKAWAEFTSSQFTEALAAIQALEKLLQHNSTNSTAKNFEQLWGLMSALKGMQVRQQGNAAESVALLETALKTFPKNNSWLRSLILLNLGVTYFVADNYEAAKQLLPEINRIGQARGMADPAIAGLYLQAQFLALRGQLEEATSLCQQGLAIATEQHWLATYAGVLVQVALGELLREQNLLDIAAQHLIHSIDRAIQNHQPGLMMGYITLARVRQAQGDFQGAWTAINAAERCQPWLWPTILSVEACKVRLHLAEGNVDAAIAWAERSGLGIEDELRYSSTEQFPGGSELDYLTFARVLLAYGQQQRSSTHLQDALRLLTRLFDFSHAGGRTSRMMEVLLLKALVLQAQADQEHSLDCLNQALNLPRHGHYIRLFLDEGKPMVALLQSARAKKFHATEVNALLVEFGAVEEKAMGVQPLIECLTERELEVLHYLATGMPNQTIADQLFVSLAAIKWHARNIYGKLAVNNRTQAVAKARKLGLLP